MAQTIYASFVDVDRAEKAAGALLDHGVQKEDISLVASSRQEQLQEQEVGISPELAYEAAAVQPYGSTIYFDPNAIGSPGTTAGIAPLAPAADSGAGASSAHSEGVAKDGITTTTPEDAGFGAIKGTEVGLGVGILAGLAALAVPGVGIVIGGGALAAALGVTALTTGAGAAVGGVIGYLKDQGIPDTSATRYQQTVGSGGALLAVNIPSNGVGLQETELLLNKYGATDISTY